MLSAQGGLEQKGTIGKDTSAAVAPIRKGRRMVCPLVGCSAEQTLPLHHIILAPKHQRSQ